MKILKKITKIVLGVFLGLAVLDVVLVFGIGHSKPKIPQDTDAVIILGAAINTPALYNRSLEGLHLYEQGKAKVLVLSGGRISDEDMSEAEYMQWVMLKNSSKLPPTILEQDSHSTYDNIRNSKKLIPNAHSIIIVSDEFHVARGVLMAKAAGFDHVYWSSPQPTYYKSSELTRYYFRELVAMFAYIPKFLFG